MPLITLQDLIDAGQVIFDETQPGANTHERVGQLFIDLVSMWTQPYQPPSSQINTLDPPALITLSETMLFDGTYDESKVPFSLEMWTAPPQASTTDIPRLTNWILLLDTPSTFQDGDWVFADYQAWANVYGDPNNFLGERAPFMIVERDDVGRRSIADLVLAFIIDEL